MIEVGKVLVSDDVLKKRFVCDLDKCKGACCVEGDLGAPVNEDEIEILEDIYDEVEPYLSEAGRKEIEKQGVVVSDWEGEFSTPTINGKECTYAIYDEKNILKCGIEQAYLDKKIEWQKPISCHLYPIRVSKLQDIDALNYDSWSICSPACALGEELKVEVYKFLKGPLTRKYGQEWYEELVRVVDAYNASKK